jgi:uncharacterized membrane protein YqhA
MLERLFDRALWLSRLVMVIPVIASVVLGCAAFYIGTVDVIYVFAHLGSYADLAGSMPRPAAIRVTLPASIIQAMGIYLLAAILLILGLGLYELVVGKIDTAERAAFASRLLLIQTVDGLKERLGTMTVLVLIVVFLQAFC